MENVDFKNKFWPSSYDGVQRFVGEIKNQLNLISNIRAYVKKRCKLYEVFIKDLQKQIPSKEELITELNKTSITSNSIRSCQPYYTLFIASLDSEIKKLNKTHLDGLHAIELLDKADQAYATFKENYQKQYSQLITESGALSSANNNIGVLVESYKSAKSSLKKFQEENHKDQYTADKHLKKIEKEISNSIEKREKIRLSFIELVEDFIPPLKTLSTTILDLIDDFIHAWITIVVDLSIASEDTNEIQKALNSLSTVGALEKMLTGLSSRGYAPRKIKFNPDSLDAPLILEDGTKVYDSEFVVTKDRNSKKMNITASLSFVKKCFENTESQKSVPPPDNHNITIRNKSLSSPQPSKSITNAGVDTASIQNTPESFDVINEPTKPKSPKLLGNSVFYIPLSQKHDEKENTLVMDLDEDKDKNKNLFNVSDDSKDDPIHKLNMGIMVNSSNPSLPKPSIEAPNSVLITIPTSPQNQNLDNSKNLATSQSFQGKNIINSHLFVDFNNNTVSSTNNVINTPNISTCPADPKDVFPSSLNQLAKLNEKLPTYFNTFASKPMRNSKSNDLFANPAHNPSQPKTIGPKNNPFSNNIDFSTKINSKTSLTKHSSIYKTDYSSITENSASNSKDFFIDKNKDPFTSYDMLSVSTPTLIENDQILKTVDFFITNNNKEDSSPFVNQFPNDLDPFSSQEYSLFNLSKSEDTKKYSISFKIHEILSCFMKQQIEKYSLKGSVTFSLSDEDVQTLSSISSHDFPKLSFAITHNDAFTNQFSTANSLVEKTFKNEKSETIFNIDKAEFKLILEKFLKEHKADHFIDFPLLNYEISSLKLAVKPYSITIEPLIMDEKKVILCVSIICAPLDAWCAYYPEFSAVSKNAIVTLVANRIRSKSPLKIESLLPTNVYKWAPKTSRLQWIIRELISQSKASLSVSNYQFKITISSESEIDLDDDSKILGVSITFNLGNTLVSSKKITISDTSMFCLDNTEKKLSSGEYLTEI